ncbi:hypothetical protein ACT29H_16635 [Thermophagus sp. OGC60D27]|uniref:hypothetical protein n=1 Tax=Thermophagus sp. OGC60D27 TaxID=3458415 RepID=UPI00403785B2
MKKLILISIIFLFFIGSSVFSQTEIEILSDTLIREHHGLTMNSNDSIIVYRDYYPETIFPSPKAKAGKFLVEFNVESINTKEKLFQIRDEIFTSEELALLAKYRFTASLVVSSSGKVKSASFLFIGGDPGIELKKLIEYSNQIKRNITLTISFFEKVVEAGYVGQYIVLYR